MKGLIALTQRWYRRYRIFIYFILAIALVSCLQLRWLHKPALTSQIIVSSSVEPNTFNPQLMEEGAGILTYLYEGLVRENERDEIEPALAESWEFSSDRRKIIFTLRKGLKWSDGKPLTANDVVFTYEDIYKNPAINAYAMDFLKIGKNREFPTLKKLDDWRVEFTLPEPFYPFLRITRMEILPAHVLQSLIHKKDPGGRLLFLSAWSKDTPPEQIISNGPYQLESYIPGERITFRKNPHYWRKDDQGNPQPYIERIIQQTVSNDDTALIQFRAGVLDFIKVNIDYFSLLKREENKGKFTIYNGGKQTTTTVITFNLNTGDRHGKPLVDPIKSRWFNTVEFRQAIAYSINRQRLLNTLFKGLGALQNSPIAEQSPYYLSPEAGLPVYDYNIDQAKALLIQAGFQYNSQGQLLDSASNRVEFTLTYNVAHRTLQNMAPLIQQDLKKIGIKVNLHPIAVTLVVDKLMNTMDWECQIFNGFPMAIEPHDTVNFWSTESNWHFFNRQPQGKQTPVTGRLVPGWEQKITDLYLEGSTTWDETKRKQIYATTQKLSQEYLPFIYLVNSLSMVAVRDQIQGVKHSALQSPFWNVHELTLDNANNL
ncbi:ABC transporter substrate-binding protein [Moorena producens JHB]|uniref:ABC transporter substrate-binding protein n=1 Tax=Moorena producens (strain JHB) TaxID=1454205 RepID=A0A1D9G0X7_MOOP1|nr:ABC transporter substrate-binding protein [Moorena producens]AOY81263.2 ABC transporter substrate-binding protein [Moorena producens JHB]